MTTITLPRAVVEQALEVINDTAYGAPVFRQEVRDTIIALRAALAQQAEPVQEPAFHGFMSDDGTQVDVCFSPSAPRRDGTYATAYYTAPPQRPTEPVQGPEGMVEFLADLQRSRTKYPKNRRMFDGLMGEIDELRRAYAGDGDIRAEAFDVAVCAFRIATEGDAGGNARLEKAESDHETRAELAEQQVVQLAEERDHYRNLWQKAQQAEPVAERAFLERILAAMEGVIDVADRKTAEFDALRSCVIDLTVMLRAALVQQAEPVQDQRCRAEPRSDGDFVCDCKIGECPGRSAEPAQQAEPFTAAEPGAWVGDPSTQDYASTQPEPVEPVDVGLLEYRGNSVAFIHQKMTAYRSGIDAAWDAFRAKGLHPDGKTSLADMIAKHTAPSQRKPLTEKEMYIVEEEARKNFRLSQAGPRGQMITYWDSLTPWLIRAVERAHGIKE